jgi:hypothetical protein
LTLQAAACAPGEPLAPAEATAIPDSAPIAAIDVATRMFTAAPSPFLRGPKWSGPSKGNLLGVKPAGRIGERCR